MTPQISTTNVKSVPSLRFEPDGKVSPVSGRQGGSSTTSLQISLTEVLLAGFLGIVPHANVTSSFILQVRQCRVDHRHIYSSSQFDSVNIFKTKNRLRHEILVCLRTKSHFYKTRLTSKKHLSSQDSGATARSTIAIVVAAPLSAPGANCVPGANTHLRQRLFRRFGRPYIYLNTFTIYCLSK